MITAHLFGGPLDGAIMNSDSNINLLSLPQACHRRSDTWSAYFRRPTFIHAGFKGMPPKEPTAA